MNETREEKRWRTLVRIGREDDRGGESDYEGIERTIVGEDHWRAHFC